MSGERQCHLPHKRRHARRRTFCQDRLATAAPEPFSTGTSYHGIPLAALPSPVPVDWSRSHTGDADSPHAHARWRIPADFWGARAYNPLTQSERRIYG